MIAWTLSLALAAWTAALTWSSGEPLPRGVDHHATFVTNGGAGPLLHVLGGNDYRAQYREHVSAAIRPDGSLGPWTTQAPFPKVVLGHTVLVVGGTAVSIAGQDTARRNSSEVYTATVQPDGSLGPWTAAPPLPAARFHHAAVEHRGFLYVLGGLETTTSTNTVFRSRVGPGGVVGPWQALDTMPRPRSHQAAVVHGGRLYLVGGLDGNPAGQNAPLSDVISSRIGGDGSLGPWEPAGAMDSAYGTHGAFAHQDYLYVMGGVENNRRFSDRVQRAPLRADGTLGPWEDLPPLPQARGHVHHLPVVNGVVYSAGGSRSRQVITDVFMGRLER